MSPKPQSLLELVEALIKKMAIKQGLADANSTIEECTEALESKIRDAEASNK